MSAATTRRSAPLRPVDERTAVEFVAVRLSVLGRRCLAGGLFLAPVIVNLRAGPSFSTTKLAVLSVAGVAALYFAVASCTLRRRWPPAFRVGAASAAYLVAVALATALSLSPRLSLLGLDGRYGGLLPLALYVGIMLAVVALHWEHPASLGSVLAAIGASSAVVAVFVLLQQAGVDRILWAGPVKGGLLDYPVGTLGQPNFAGAHLGMGLPALWYVFVSERRPLAKSAVLAAIGVVAAALWFTQSRGGMLAGLIGLTVMAASERRRRWTWRRRVIAIAAITVSATLLVAAWALSWASGDHPLGDRGGILRTKTIELRFSYWTAAVGIFWDHPLVGTGPDTFYAYYPQRRTVRDGALSETRIGVDKPHNVILEHASDSGGFGALAYLAVVVLALRHGHRRRRALRGRDGLVLSAFLGLLCAYLAQAFFSIDVPSTAVVGWVAIGGLAALSDPGIVRARERADSTMVPGNRRPGPRPLGSARRVALCLLLAVAAVWLGATGLRPVEAEVAMNAGRRAQAIRLDPLDADLRLRAGFDAKATADENPSEQRALLGQARDLYLQSLQLKPRDSLAMIRLAELETAWAERIDPSHFADAERWWRRALASDPNNQTLTLSFDGALPPAERRTVARLEADASARPRDVPSHLRLASAYVALKEPDKARATLSLVLTLDPANSEASRLLASLR